MKKTIVIVILVVYIASIAVVNCFGLKIEEFDHYEYVQEIKCNGITVKNENPKSYGVYKVSDEGIPEYRFDFIKGNYTKDPESLASNPNVVYIDCEVLPHTAENPNIAITFDEAGMENFIYFDAERQCFIFLANKKRITVTISATDGSGVQTQIKIMSR